MTNFGILAILAIVFIAALALVLLALFLRQPSKQTTAKTEMKTQLVVQRFVSNDLKKRAFIIQLDEGGFKVVYQQYSNRVINRGGEVAGWQDLPEKPVTDSLSDAVKFAQGWVHAED
jgi:hypothetical protein